MPPTKARFASTHDRINATYLLRMGNFSLNGEIRATQITNLRYWKNHGIAINARAGRHGPPKSMSIVDFASRNFDQYPGCRGVLPVAKPILVHAAPNTIPDIKLAMKLYAKIIIAPRYTTIVNASVLSLSPIFLVQYMSNKPTSSWTLLSRIVLMDFSEYVITFSAAFSVPLVKSPN